MIDEYELVALTKPLPEFKLVAGDVGTVVLVHTKTKGYTVEFMTLNGDSAAVVSVDEDFVRRVGKEEMTHARKVA